METVRDVGHMLGHGESRKVGISVRRVNSFYDIIAFQMPLMNGPAKKPIDLSNAPVTIFAAMDATFDRIDDSILHRETGLSRAQISTKLTKIKRKFSEYKPGLLRWNLPFISNTDEKVIKCLTSFIISEAAYTGEAFFNELTSLLLRYGFLDAGQERQFEERRSFVILFALTAMHGVRFLLRDGGHAEAEAGWATGAKGALLNVGATMVVPGGPPAGIGFPVFDTSLRAEDWYADYSPDRPNARWKVPIELSVEGKIVTLD